MVDVSVWVCLQHVFLAVKSNSEPLSVHVQSFSMLVLFLTRHRMIDTLLSRDIWKKQVGMTE